MSFSIVQKENQGIIEDAPLAQKIETGNYMFLLEHGRIRYFSWCGKEFIRMVHAAVRDENWMTVPYTVNELNIVPDGDHLLISFDIRYQSKTIEYSAKIKIRAGENGFEYSFSGVADNDFLRNRIGICVLLPVETCSKQPCVITHADYTMEHGFFPGRISAHQPFKDFKAIEWQTTDGVRVQSVFEGDIFEIEDQRNWSDHSFKIYGTPLDVPFPVQVNKGDIVTQSVSLDFNFPEQKIPKPSISLQAGHTIKNMPAVGLRYTGQIPEYKSVGQLIRRLNLHHLRIDLHFNENWERELRVALATAVEINSAVELVMHAGNDDLPVQQCNEIVIQSGADLFSVLILSSVEPVSDAGHFSSAIQQIKKNFKQVLIGTGSSLHFAEINRYFTAQAGTDFIAFPLNPQVHADDTLTMVENLQACRDILNNAFEQYNGLPVHVSRLTLRYPFNPDQSGLNRYDSIAGKPWTEDFRQHSLFCAAWLALSFKYLAGAGSITFFDDYGPGGIIPERNKTAGEESKQMASPSFLIFAELAVFRAVSVLDIVSHQPLITDAVCFMNAANEVLFIMVNWQGETLHVETDTFLHCINCRYKTLNHSNLQENLESPFQWAGLQYKIKDDIGTGFQIEAGEVLFVTATRSGQ